MSDLTKIFPHVKPETVGHSAGRELIKFTSLSKKKKALFCGSRFKKEVESFFKPLTKRMNDE